MTSLTKDCDTCIFDLYGTLVDIHTDESKADVWKRLALFYGYYNAFYEADELKTEYERIVKLMEKETQPLRKDAHESSPEIQIELVFKQLFDQKGVCADMTLAVHAGQFFRVLSTDYVKLYDGTDRMLKTIKDTGRKLYLLSNAQRIFTEYEMRALNIFKYFDGVYISSDYGVKKPDHRFFELLIKNCHICPDRAVMIGNDGVCDIAGAKAAGLATVYIHSNISPKETFPEADVVLEQMDMERLTQVLIG